jgi:hypothetical protein
VKDICVYYRYEFVRSTDDYRPVGGVAYNADTIRVYNIFWTY